MKFNRTKLILGLTILGLMPAFQNCNKTNFTSAPEESQQASAAVPAATTPVRQPTSTTMAPPPPPPSVPSGTYSTCQTQLRVEACPDGALNCTCTGTLKGGMYSDAEWVMSPPPDHTANGTGPNCRFQIPDGNANASHGGTVVSPYYGTCTNYCSIKAKCVDGQWQQIGSTW